VGEFVYLDQEVSHHLLRVTGIAPGERVELFDGEGAVAVAELCEVQGGVAQLRIVEHQSSQRRQHPVHLVVAQLRASTLDTVLRMATELGVTELTVVQSERCVARGDKRDRWERIVRSAAAQCGRADWPKIHPPCGFSEALSLPDGAVGLMCDPAAEEIVQASRTASSLLIGPEGGWTDDERRQAQVAGWELRGLGANTLRADTAAVAAISRCLT